MLQIKSTAYCTVTKVNILYNLVMTSLGLVAFDVSFHVEGSAQLFSSCSYWQLRGACCKRESNDETVDPEVTLSLQSLTKLEVEMEGLSYSDIFSNHVWSA